MPTVPLRRHGTTGSSVYILLLMVAITIHASVGLHMLRSPKIEFGDGIQYLDAAYHLRHGLTYTMSSETIAPPAIGREPAYPVVLASLMAFDPKLDSYLPTCGGSETACDPARFRVLSVANLLLIEATSLLLFQIVRRLSGSDGTALAAAAYVLINVNLLRSHWYDPASDELALTLVALAMATLQWAWGRDAPGRWCGVGLAFAALTLCKAVFLPFSFGLATWAAGHLALRRFQSFSFVRPRLAAAGCRRIIGGENALASRSTVRWARMLMLAATVYAVVIGGWTFRNWQVSGVWRFTDDRGGIALSTREVFDHMTPAQVVAAFVFWTPGGGEELARHLFAPETIAPFDLYRPGGFYDRGQNGYGRRVAALARAEGLERWQAVSIVDKAVVHEILKAPFGFAISSAPLLYRGLWIDQFALLCLPLLVWRLWRSWKVGAFLPAVLLSFGIYNEVFYALASLNMPRYQITAMPALAVTGALGCASLMRRLRCQGVPIQPASGTAITAVPVPCHSEGHRTS